MLSTDTIFALSSGGLPSGVAVVRMSGPKALRIAEVMCGRLPAHRHVARRRISSPQGAILDDGLVVAFKGPGSFTGEDCVEFHVHGGRAVVSGILAAIASFSDTRPADPGEFTRRAFLNGKMDLVEAEALSDLISAETEAQRLFALEGARGTQSTLYASWRRRLVHALAMIEAELDFSDQEDVPGSVVGVVWDDLTFLVEDIRRHVGDFHRGEIVRDGFRVVILGRPNAGKSSLFNALARRDVAIVSDEPGTTRDLLDVSLDLGGLKVTVTDTAGLRRDPGAVEAIGIEKALMRAADADLVIRLVPADDLGSAREVKAGDLVVYSKADLGLSSGAPSALGISAHTGAGLDDLTDAIRSRAEAARGSTTDVLPARIRHVVLLAKAAEAIEEALATESAFIELRAEELRRAARFLGEIAGEIGTELVLDVVFSEFCIGK